MEKKKFIHGLELNEGFYHEVVGPLMKKYFPSLRYAAGLVGHGSDVMGFDSPISMDHDWGPHLHLFFPERDFKKTTRKVDRMLRTKLPYSYKGFSTNFAEGNYYLKHTPELKKSGEVNHLFNFWTVQSFFKHYLGFDIRKKPSYKDWLLFPQQALIEVSQGKVFHDNLGLHKVRARFAYYPEDVWKYMMRTEWGRIGDELQTPARTGEEGDEVGSMIITASNVRKIMALCFLLERQYVPYRKWLGIAFRERLQSSALLYPLLLNTIREKHWKKRQNLIAHAYQILGTLHNKLGITPKVSTQLVDFHGRGYPVLRVELFIFALEKAIKNKRLKNMHYPLGSIDQFIDHARINHMNYVYTKLKNIIQ